MERNTVSAWIALATCLVLLAPLLAMQFTDAVNWSTMDFAVMGTLLFGSGSLFVLASRKVPHKYWLALGIVFAVVFLFI